MVFGLTDAPRVSIERPNRQEQERAAIAVVMDVLRMTTTAATLMAKPQCERVKVAATLEDLAHLEGRSTDHLIVSELPDAADWGTQVDNSPSQVSRMDVGHRLPVLVTTNGTRALLGASRRADRVLLASFVDLHAVARHLRHTTGRIVLVPAGHLADGTACIEDDLCAEALAALLAAQSPDFEAIQQTIVADAHVARRVQTEPHFKADLDLALRPQPDRLVLEFKAETQGLGHILRAA